MGGIAAVAICAAFTSCSKSNELFDQNAAEQAKQQEQVNKMNENYEKAFINTFGQPSPTHTWGFGATKASTRTGNTGETYAQTHGDANGGANMNHNEWADPDKEFGGWVVPDPLTAEQKAVVIAYFQSGPDIDFEDPHFRHFFVQQVYKGGSAQAGASTENITAANNSVYNSGNMNLLTVGETNIHINDYNAGTCSESDVLNNGQKVGGTSHKDQITLMVNIDDTSCFGYHETGSSTHHNNKAALVGWETIDTWAKTNYAGYNGCLKDDWNRSFMGFDLALKEGAEAYDQYSGNASYWQAPGQPSYYWDGNTIAQFTDNERYITDALGSAIGYLTTNKNFYVAGESVNLNQTYNCQQKSIDELNWNDIKNYVVLDEMKVEGAQNGKAKVLNMKRIKELVEEGYLPVNNKSLQEWVQVGTSDGYFTDWIVTLTEAERQSGYQGRIMAEDLNAVEESDFDFNDVVFDWKIEGNVATIQLRAAGGIYPLYVGDQEVHAKFGQSASEGKYPMINTGAGVTATASSYTYTFPEGTEAKAVNIPIYVIKDGSTKAYLDASTGKAASKFNTKTTTRWVKEFEDILDAYPDFKGWVANENLDWTTNKNLDYIY